MSKTLLLADDSITIQKVVGITFANEDYKIVSVDNGEDAVNKAGTIRPDIILADVVMPKLDGYQVCEKIKADPNLRHIPVLLLTGAFKPFDENRSKQAGADGHIAKPFDSQTLIDKVKELVSRPPKVAPAPVVAPIAPVPPKPQAPAPTYSSFAPPPSPSGKLDINPSFENAFASQSTQEEGFQNFAPSMEAFSSNQDPFTTPTEKSSQDFFSPPAPPPAPVAREESWDNFGETTSNFDETPMASEPLPSEMPSPMELSMFEGLASQAPAASESAAQEIPENIWNVPVAEKPFASPPPPISAPSFPAQEAVTKAPPQAFIPPAPPPSFATTPFAQAPQAPSPFFPPAASTPVAPKPAFSFTPPVIAPAAPKPPVFTPPPTPDPPSFSFDSFEDAPSPSSVAEPPVENMEWLPSGSIEAELPPMPPPELQSEPPIAFKAPSFKEAPAPNNGSDAALKGMTREVIEKIAWEIIPDLAESIIREEIERLKREKGVFK